jgi:hypothetical protein
MMKNNKAWIRIVEATIAVLLLASVLFIMIIRIPATTDDGSRIREAERFALETISKNSTLRGYVLTNNLDKVNSSLITSLSAYSSQWAWDFKICNVESACGIDKYPDKEVYADEILISSTLQTYSPKKLRLFVWEK